MSNIRIGIAGATGYSGRELLRLAAGHPNVDPVVAMASTDGHHDLPALDGIWKGTVEGFSLERLAQETDVVFLSLPDAVSAEISEALIALGSRVFDLSGAFRLRDETPRRRWYPKTRDLEVRTVYGLPEWNRSSLNTARLIACAGCYPTAALLALTPLVSAGLVAREGSNYDIYIDAKSGISGAGKKPSERTHFSEVHGSISAYGVFEHRHAAEIEQELARRVTFAPHLIPIDRGIFETIFTRVRPGTKPSTIQSVFEEAYKDAPFVRFTGERLPEIKHVSHTNFCDIGYRLDGERLILISCLDNLIKGAAGQALQCFNIAFGLDECDGLL